MAFFMKLEHKISQFIWKHKRPRMAKAVLRKKSGAGGINFPDLKIKLQSYSHQDSKYGTGTKTEIQTNGTR